MCGRAITPDTREIVRHLHLHYDANWFEEDQNVPPTLQLPLFTDEKPQELQYFRWSLIPFWAKELPKFSTFNAKLENLKVSGTWKHLLGKRHCVIITNGFYEWKKLDPKGKQKQPYLIRTRSERFTLMAGLWDRWTDRQTGEIINSCTIITLPPNNMMKEVHDRMPGVLTLDQARIWTDSQLSADERLQVLQDIPDERLQAVPIEKVGDVASYAQLFTYC